MVSAVDFEVLISALLPTGSFGTVGEEPSYSKLIRGTNFILAANNPVSYEDIRLVAPSVFYDAYIFIASARNLDNTFLYTKEEAFEMMRFPEGTLPPENQGDRYNTYATGVHGYIAKLIAAELIRRIPLNNSSIKQVDVAEAIQTQAYKGLERIINLYTTTSVEENTEIDIKNKRPGIYISHALNKATIEESAFSIPDNGSSPPTFDGVVNLSSSVNTVDVVSYPDENTTGFCYVYMTGQAYDADKDAVLSAADVRTSASVSFKIETAIEIEEGSDLDSTIALISEGINSQTLEQASINSNTVANILVSPNTGGYVNTTVNRIKKQIYPETETFKNRIAVFNLLHKINRLEFSVRRLSSKVSTELIILSLYTCNTDVLEDYYQNRITLNQLKKDENTSLGIDSLLLGQSNYYGALEKKATVSLLLNVDKGNVATVSIKADSNNSSSSENADSIATSSSLSSIDTFYFSAINPIDPNSTNPQPFTGFSSDLIMRVSSSTYKTQVPLNIKVDLTTEPILVAEEAGIEVASRMVDAIYKYTRETNINQEVGDNSNILGVLLGEYENTYLNINRTANTVTELPLQEGKVLDDGIVNSGRFISSRKQLEIEKDEVSGRCQIVAFKYRKEEFNVVVDIIKVPSELWIATGNYMGRKTSWKLGKRKSLKIDTKVLNQQGATEVETESETLSSVDASISKSAASISPLLQRVYDKKANIQRSKDNSYGKYYPNQNQGYRY